jgi:hypothetical protein
LLITCFSVNFDNPIRLGEKFEIVQIEKTKESTKESETAKKEKKAPSKGLRLGKKKTDDEY